ncbi:MAG: hypothetical protein Q7R70_06290 [Candidatus Diapherotrites archaeon]|nr:hypothetical protein [Candidatus Diapherotrites archaeon]
MKGGKALGFGAKVIVFLAAFAVVIVFNAFISPEISSNARFWFRTGDYFSLIIVLAETFILGSIFRALLMWAFKMQFERKELRRSK